MLVVGVQVQSLQTKTNKRGKMLSYFQVLVVVPDMGLIVRIEEEEEEEEEVGKTDFYWFGSCCPPESSVFSQNSLIINLNLIDTTKNQFRYNQSDFL